MAVAREAIGAWGGERHLRAALIKGSTAEAGTVPRGGDLDLLLVVDGAPDDRWFQEVEVAGVPVELFPIDRRRLDAVDEILADHTLPFDLTMSIVVSDPEGIIAPLRRRLLPELVRPRWRLARAEAMLGAARQEHGRAGRLLREDGGEAGQHLSVALWHAAAAGTSLAGRRPTTRRAFVALDAAVGGEDAVLGPAAEALSRQPLSAATVSEIITLLEAGDRRVRDAVEAMLDRGERRWAAFPLLCSALWRSSGRRHEADSSARALTELGWCGDELGARVNAADRLLRALAAIAPDRAEAGPTSREP